MEKEANNAVSPQDIKGRIAAILSDDYIHTDYEIARSCGIAVAEAHRLMDEDPDLRLLKAQSERNMAQKIERSAMELATDCENKVAQQKAQEFMLRKLMPEKYGDNADQSRSARSMKRIMLVKELPVVEVDENGIPVAHSVSPLSPKEIEMV